MTMAAYIAKRERHAGLIAGSRGAGNGVMPLAPLTSDHRGASSFARRSLFLVDLGPKCHSPAPILRLQGTANRETAHAGQDFEDTAASTRGVSLAVCRGHKHSSFPVSVSPEGTSGPGGRETTEAPGQLSIKSRRLPISRTQLTKLSPFSPCSSPRLCRVPIHNS
ncbi:hypothetical protein CLCR_10927 [Cladophialophora carrionii]|uniref:Uncharacterized protein n=1 Tax=Cladophialophora carrionii TaxID=86049 RepID=A0A1C1CY78_9EURO|nr:hypothetical protein CLCR_10927 [Cladophialophora carrionii]